MNLQKKLIMNKLFYIVLFTLLFIFSCSDNDEAKTRKVDYDPAVMPDQIGRDVKVIFADSSITKAVLYAGVAKIYNKRKETILDSNVRVEFFEENIHTSTLTCKEAKIDDKTKNMLAKKDVVVVSLEENRKLETSILSWDESTRRIYSTEYVKITTENEIIEGYGFESDPDLTDYRLHKVSGIQNIEGRKNE